MGSLDISISQIFSGFLFGIVGLWLFGQAKRREDPRLAIIGVLLMIYPYFTSKPIADWGIGIALCGLAYRIW